MTAATLDPAGLTVTVLQLAVELATTQEMLAETERTLAEVLRERYPDQAGLR